MEPMELDIEIGTNLSNGVGNISLNSDTKPEIKKSSNVCNICRDEIDPMTNMIRLKNCFHKYCEDCLKNWIKHSNSDFSYDNNSKKAIICMYCKKKSPLFHKKDDEVYLKNYHMPIYSKHGKAIGMENYFCKAIKKSNGEQCCNKAKPGEDYCGVHRNYIPKQ